jgi:5-dehydro-2-deoxygluconokinase
VTLELVTVGRVSVDLYAREQGVGFADVETFAKSIGGSPTNVAVAAARLGRRAALITAVGADPFGEYVRGALTGFGVDVRFVGTHPTLRTPLAFAAMDPPEDPQLLFYREPDAPDMQIELASIDRAAVREAAILWISASALSAEPSRGTALALMRDRDRSTTILDLDYRPTFWRDEAEASAVIGAALDLAGIAVGNREECRVAVGSRDPAQAADALLARGCRLAIVKQGADGVLVATAAGREVVPGLRVPVVCGLGAGDAFGGALCHGLLDGRPPVECVRFANAAGAIVASRLLCADAMPDDAEVRALLAT